MNAMVEAIALLIRSALILFLEIVVHGEWVPPEKICTKSDCNMIYLPI